MKAWSRIVLVTFVLLGATLLFGFWSLNQFNTAFEDMGAHYIVMYPLVHKPSTTATATLMIAASAGSISLSPATSTATTSDDSSGKYDLDLKFKFDFPSPKERVYIGCTYEISWSASTTIIKSLEIALIDAGTHKPTGPIASGISKENIIDNNSQSLKWKVGIVWPGVYYIKVSKINGIETNFKSKIFEINKIPEDTSVEEREKICQGSYPSS